MTYQHILDSIATTLPDHVYYNLLLDNASTIVARADTTSKKQVAEELGMNPVVFSTAYKFLLARSLAHTSEA